MPIAVCRWTFECSTSGRCGSGAGDSGLRTTRLRLRGLATGREKIEAEEANRGLVPQPDVSDVARHFYWDFEVLRTLLTQ